MYTYTAKDIKVIDGDTIIATLDQGFSTMAVDRKFRLSRINAPELKTPEGIVSKKYLEKLLSKAKEVIIKTIKAKKTPKETQEKYGRYLAELFIDSVNINDKMIADGYAVIYNRR